MWEQCQKIANALKMSGVKNPLILLDEIDKVSNDYKGDTFFCAVGSAGQ